MSVIDNCILTGLAILHLRSGQPLRIGDAEKKWITTESGSHIQLDENGTIIAGAGGKFNGKNIKEMGGTKKFTKYATNAERAKQTEKPRETESEKAASKLTQLKEGIKSKYKLTERQQQKIFSNVSKDTTLNQYGRGEDIKYALNLGKPGEGKGFLKLSEKEYQAAKELHQLLVNKHETGIFEQNLNEFKETTRWGKEQPTPTNAEKAATQTSENWQEKLTQLSKVNKKQERGFTYGDVYTLPTGEKVTMHGGTGGLGSSRVLARDAETGKDMGYFDSSELTPYQLQEQYGETGFERQQKAAFNKPSPPKMDAPRKPLSKELIAELKNMLENAAKEGEKYANSKGFQAHKLTEQEWNKQWDSTKAETFGSAGKPNIEAQLSRVRKARELMGFHVKEIEAAQTKLKDAKEGKIKLSKDELDDVMDIINKPVTYQDVISAYEKYGRAENNQASAEPVAEDEIAKGKKTIHAEYEPRLKELYNKMQPLNLRKKAEREEHEKLKKEFYALKAESHNKQMEWMDNFLSKKSEQPEPQPTDTASGLKALAEKYGK